MNKELGYKCSHFATQIIVKAQERYRVRCETFVEENRPPLEETLNMGNIFPYPPSIVVDLVAGDVVDVFTLEKEINTLHISER